MKRLCSYQSLKDFLCVGLVCVGLIRVKWEGALYGNMEWVRLGRVR